MSDDFADLLGNKFMEVLYTNSAKTSVRKSFYLLMIKYLESLINESPDPSKFVIYENYQQASVVKKKDVSIEKPIYTRTITVVDKETGEETEETETGPVKKFANITADVTTALCFLFNKYIKECYDYFIENRHSFGEESKLLDNICEYSNTYSQMPIAPVIIQSSNILNIETLLEGDYGSGSKSLADKIRVFFKDEHDRNYEIHLSAIVHAFIKFEKVIGILMINMLYERRQAINISFLFGVLRLINVFLKDEKCEIDNEIFDTILKFIESAKNNKKEESDKKPTKTKKTSSKKKSKNGDDTEDDDNEEDKEDKEDDKKTSSKKKSPKKSDNPTEKKDKKVVARNRETKEETEKKTKKEVVKKDDIKKETEKKNTKKDIEKKENKKSPNKKKSNESESENEPEDYTEDNDGFAKDNDTEYN